MILVCPAVVKENPGRSGTSSGCAMPRHWLLGPRHRRNVLIGVLGRAPKSFMKLEIFAVGQKGFLNGEFDNIFVIIGYNNRW